MNDGNGSNNSPNGGQNNMIAQALVTLVQAIGNMQPAPVLGLKEQNIAQVSKFYGYGNKDPAEWVKRFDTTYLTNNWQAAQQKNIARSFLDEPAFQ